jgi:hypothetical protein
MEDNSLACFAALILSNEGVKFELANILGIKHYFQVLENSIVCAHSYLSAVLHALIFDDEKYDKALKHLKESHCTQIKTIEDARKSYNDKKQEAH